MLEVRPAARVRPWVGCYAPPFGSGLFAPLSPGMTGWNFCWPIGRKTKEGRINQKRPSCSQDQ